MLMVYCYFGAMRLMSMGLFSIDSIWDRPDAIWPTAFLDFTVVDNYNTGSSQNMSHSSYKWKKWQIEDKYNFKFVLVLVWRLAT